MSDYSKISKQMKDDWDRRIKHDYRFWMSDGHENDEAMWKSGERDFGILTAEIENAGALDALELGCGVGRLLRPASGTFRSVVGVDVSQVAIDRAAVFLRDFDNVTVREGNGVDLRPQADESLDVVMSFAALTSMPTAVIANYLTEIHRVLRPKGLLRVQCYLGEPQSVMNNDTLHIRCFTQPDFERAMKLAGFELEWIRELELPFQVSFDEIGISAKIASFRKKDTPQVSSQVVAQTLLPEGEVEGTSVEVVGPADLECWMSLNYAMQQAERGNTTGARETLEFAARHGETVSIDVRDLMGRIVNEIERQETRNGVTSEISANSLGEIQDRFSPLHADVFSTNLRALEELFPKEWKTLQKCLDSSDAFLEVEARETPDGPVLFHKGQCLDHPTKPRQAGETWAKRVLADRSFAEASHLVVFGAGAGYHLEALIELAATELSLVEPSVESFCLALGARDWTKILTRLTKLSLGADHESGLFQEGSELVVRPQTQAVNPAHCSTLHADFYGERGLGKLKPRIAVLGPMMGGTLPILDYSFRGLLSLGQRSRILNMKGFAEGFHAIDGFTQDEYRKNLLRGSYSEMLSQIVLESVSEKPIDILICLAQAPMSGRALDELRKKGVVTVFWFMEDYLRFRSWELLSKHFDFVFTIQRGECLSAVKRAGAGHVHYLPVACDPIVHRPMEVPAEEVSRWGSPISFVGAGYHNRQQVFASFAEMPFKIWGTEWPTCRPFDKLVQEDGRRIAPEEYVKIFNSTDINVNLHSSTERDGVDPLGDFINPRTFELASCGAFQLVDERKYLPECFDDGKEIVTFRNNKDLREKIGYYLERPDERRRIAEAGRNRALREHTYLHRLKEMLSIIYSVKYDHLKKREDSSPWTRMLRRAVPHPELHQRCKVAFERGEEPILDALVSDIVTGEGKLSETEQKLLFLFHVRKQIIRMKREEMGDKGTK